MSERLADYLSLIPIFSSLQPEEILTIERYMFFNKIESGEYVLKEGDKSNYVCFVVSGSLDVVKLNRHAKPVLIATLAKGGSIGEMALIDKQTHSASVRACTPTKLVVLTRKGFDLILKAHPEIGIKILKGMALVLSMNLRKTTDKLADLLPPLA